MGYNKFNLKFIQNILDKVQIYSMLELGNQCINTRETNISDKIGKIYFTKKNIEHISIDLNGKDGAIKLDLTERLPEDLENRFDLITNCGTTEHIFNQFEVFRNLHNAGNINCYYVNSVPIDTNENQRLYGRNTAPHGLYEYNTDFFRKLCEKCNYGIIDINSEIATWPDNPYCNAIYKKNLSSLFISNEDFNELIKEYTIFYPNGSTV